MLLTASEVNHYRRNTTATPPAPRGRLTYLYASINPQQWIALCSCGNYCISDSRSKSCGCLVRDVSCAAACAARRVLSPEALADIRSSRERYKILAARWGVSTDTIGSVKSGRRYGGV